MNSTIHLLDVVALAEDLPAQSLSRGQVGTVVEEPTRKRRTLDLWRRFCTRKL